MKSFPLSSTIIAIVTTVFMSYADISSEAYERLLLFPHQIAISEFICTGFVSSTNDNYTFDISLDELLLGNADVTNIIIGCISRDDRLDLELNKKYLVFAFTNNWWNGNRPMEELSCDIFSNQLPPTNYPANLVPFANHKVMNPNCSVISFDRINVGGTNYWPAMRTFTTNYIEATRVQRNVTMADETINSFLNQNGERNFPKEFKQQVLLYKITKGLFDEPIE